MNILVISGFLGAGKTTFIRTLTKHTGSDLAVLENEYGGAGIDGEILKKDTDAGELNIWELTEGCICCSMKGDFAASVLTIANTVDPECLIIEPTGVGFLSNIISNLQQIEYERIRLLRPVTIVDGHSFERYSREFTDLYSDQVAVAGTVFVSKMEQADEEEKESLRTKLSLLAPDSRIVTDHYSTMSEEEWRSLLETSFDGRSLKQDLPGTEDMPNTFTISKAVMKAPEDLLMMLECLIHGKFGNIIRAKGVVSCGKYLFRFDVADGRYAVTGEDANAENRVVFIGRDMDRRKVRRCFFERANIRKLQKI